MSEYKFETLQLHVGQETPDSATDARFTPRLRMYFIIANTRRRVSGLPTREISTVG